MHKNELTWNFYLGDEFFLYTKSFPNKTKHFGIYIPNIPKYTYFSSFKFVIMKMSKARELRFLYTEMRYLTTHGT